MKSVIVNADDFGLSDGICKSILELINNDAVSSTSLMLAADGAIPRIKKWHDNTLQNCTGVHLQLTGGTPLGNPKEVYNLINGTTQRFSDPRQASQLDLNQIEKEWRLQISIASDLLGCKPTHLDTHHGVHRIPQIYEIYKKLANELEISMRGAVSGEIKTNILRDDVRATIAIVREWTGKNYSSERLIDEILNVIDLNPQEECLEIVCHPGYLDSQLIKISSLSHARENDHKVLLDLGLKDWWRRNNFCLITHKEFYNGEY